MSYIASLIAILLLLLLAVLVAWPARTTPLRIALAAILLVCAASTALHLSDLFSLLPPRHPTWQTAANWAVIVTVASILFVLWRSRTAGDVQPPRRRTFLLSIGAVTLVDLISATVAKPSGAPKSTARSAKIALRTPIRTGAAFVNGVTIAYRDLGAGPPMVLIHGFPETGAAFDAVLDTLAAHYRLIVPDLRGFGASDRTAGGYDKANVARDIAALLDGLSIVAAHIVGHDIGSRVAFAFAAQFPTRTQTLTVTEAILEGLPGTGLIRRFGWLIPPAKHFAIFAEPEAAEARFKGRERDLILWFMNSKSFALRYTEADVRDYVASFERERGMWAAFKHYETLWTRDAAFNRDVNAQAMADIPALVLSGDHGGGGLLADQLRSLGLRKIRAVVIPDAGHWIFAERPTYVAEQLLSFAK